MASGFPRCGGPVPCCADAGATGERREDAKGVFLGAFDIGHVNGTERAFRVTTGESWEGQEGIMTGVVTRMVLAIMLMVGSAPFAAEAVPVALTPDAGTFQQTQNNPCVIGNPSCNNPAGFGFTTLPVNPTSPQITTSPTYSVDQIRTLLGGTNTFFIGVDISQAQGQPAYTLNSFTVNIAGADTFQFTGPQDFTSSGNGSPTSS